jgi:hypothetical protein
MDIQFDDLKNFGTGISIKETEKSLDKQEEEIFYSIIERMAALFKRTQQITELGIDLTEYDNDFFALLEDMIMIIYGPIKSEIIFWWIYDMPSVEKTTPIYLVDSSGNKTQIKNVKQLYKYLKRID